MKLSHRKLYHYRDIEWPELRLIRIGHALWAMLRQAKRGKSYLLSEIRAIEEAIETIVQLKREYRAERDARWAARSAEIRERFKGLQLN